MSVTQPPSESPTKSSLTSKLTTSSNQPVRTLGQSPDVALSGARTVFGQVMGLVALTVGCAALGAYVGRDLSGGAGILFFIAGFACVFGLQFATARGREQLAIGLLFGLGLALGLAGAPGSNPESRSSA